MPQSGSRAKLSWENIQKQSLNFRLRHKPYTQCGLEIAVGGSLTKSLQSYPSKILCVKLLKKEMESLYTPYATLVFLYLHSRAVSLDRSISRGREL